MIYIKHPKCAGTLILREIIEKNYKKEYFNFDPAFSSASIANPKKFNEWLKNLSNLEDYFIFTVVRNPYAKVWSAYNHIYEKHNRKHTERIRVRHPKRASRRHSEYDCPVWGCVGMVTPEVFFNNLIINEPNQFFRTHWVPYYPATGNKNIYDYICKMEDGLDEGIELLLKKLKIKMPKTIPIINPTTYNYNYDKKYNHIIEDLYREDFLLFDYNREGESLVVVSSA